MRIQRYDSLNLRDFRLPFEAVEAASPMVEDEAPAPPPPPSYTQHELEIARQAAHKAGFEEGVQAGVAKVVNETHLRDNDAAEAMQKLAQSIQQLHSEYQAILDKQTGELTELVTLIARKVAGDALTMYGEKTIEGMVMRCLPVVLYKPHVLIDVHPDIHEKVEGHLTRLLRESGFTGGLTVRASTTISRHDIKIDWAAGYAERSTQALWAEVAMLLDQLSIQIRDEPTNNETTSN
ncbi:MAG: hypothetical protein J0M34_02620 [Alphaproteobacteria bacterium]|nr:hypothetical protein [Alphaproteobacteria bacterium]